MTRLNPIPCALQFRVKNNAKPTRSFRLTPKSINTVWRQAQLIAFAALVAPLVAAEEPAKIPDYKNTELSFEVRAKDLVERMSLSEKIPQLVNDAPAIPRLGVREYNWWNEGLHGVAALGEATVFPQAIGMAATWDEPLMRQVADVIGVEFRAKHLQNQHRFGGSDWFGGLTVWSPNVNIFRDPRWGRGQETYGEDPHLTSRLGVAFVKGLQGPGEPFLRTVATPKHYAVHSGPEATRHSDDIHPNAKDLEETYLPAFQATVVEGGAGSVMCAYNAVDGVPACASHALMKERLRNDWGFDGYVVSDCGAVLDIYTEDHHGYKKTPEEGVAVAFASGMDLICGDANEAEHIESAVRKGLLSEAQLDESLVRLFTARMQLGQFNPRTEVFPNITAKDFDTDAHRALALKMAEESLVLLKNEDEILPLSKKVRKLAVVGPNAEGVDVLVGNYNGEPSAPVTIIEGIKKRFAKAKVVYERGSGLLDPVQSPVPDAQLCVDAKCRERGLKAEYFADSTFTGEPTETRTQANATVTWSGYARTGAVRWSGFLKAPETGTYTFRYEANGGYRIWVDGEMVIDAWGVDWRPVIASGSVTLNAGESYGIKVEAFQRGEQGTERLVWSLPSNPGMAAAVAAAKAADVTIFVAGLTAQLEGEEMPVPLPGFVWGDRTDIELPAVQRELFKQLVATKTPVVVVLMSGSALAVNEIDRDAAAVIQAWYPGGEGGQAVANLLAGDFSPAGRLPVTFYKSVGQLPPFGDYSMAGRTYRYFEGEPLYPFGFGLSYTQFAYSDFKVAPASWDGRGELNAEVTVTNTGKRDGDEVVQLYLTHSDLPGAPLRSLIGFERVHLKKGESRTLTFALGEQSLTSVDEQGERRLAPGQKQFWVGGGQPNQPDRLPRSSGASATVTLTK